MKVEWNGHKVTPNEKILLEHIVEGQRDEGITTDDVRYLLDGEPLSTRRALHALAKRKLLKKKIIKRTSMWAGYSLTKKVALFYPPNSAGNI